MPQEAALGTTLAWIPMWTVESPISKYVDPEKEQDFLLLQKRRHSVNVSEYRVSGE
jgi:hypothetical protein